VLGFTEPGYVINNRNMCPTAPAQTTSMVGTMYIGSISVEKGKLLIDVKYITDHQGKLHPYSNSNSSSDAQLL
jgi:hypothetical protein